MADKAEKTSKLDKIKKVLDLLGGVPKALAGLAMIMALAGGMYGSFKPETDARETYDVLAPEIDMIITQSDGNSTAIAALEKRLVRVEAEKEILQGLLLGFLTAQGKFSAPEPLMIAEELDEDFEGPPSPAPPPPPPALIRQAPEQHIAPVPVQRKPRARPYWEQKQSK